MTERWRRCSIESLRCWIGERQVSLWSSRSYVSPLIEITLAPARPAFHTPPLFMPDAFPKISAIQFEGPKSRNPLAFKHYNASEKIEGKTMRDHLRFSVVYWHTMCGAGSDMFGSPTALRPWENGLKGLDLAKAR